MTIFGENEQFYSLYGVVILKIQNYFNFFIDFGCVLAELFL